MEVGRYYRAAYSAAKKEGNVKTNDITGLLEKYLRVPGERFFAELYETNEYLPARTANPKIVIDVGACAGEFCAYVYEQAETIYAIEPYHFKELSDNVRDFGLEKIKAFNIAISGSNGKRNFTTDEPRGGNFLTTHATGMEVETQTLSCFMKSQGITHVDVLKIDIEGGEEEVFNAPDFQEVVQSIDMIIGEHINLHTGEMLNHAGFTAYAHKFNTVYYRST